MPRNEAISLSHNIYISHIRSRVSAANCDGARAGRGRRGVGQRGRRGAARVRGALRARARARPAGRAAAATDTVDARGGDLGPASK